MAGSSERQRSVEKFQALMKRIPQTLRVELGSEIKAQAEVMASTMRRAAATGDDPQHELRDSVRVEAGEHDLKVYVKAGGPATTHPVRQGASATYDYANAVEYGTEEVKAQPFFWPSYRLTRRRVRAAINRRAKAAIKREAQRGG